MSLTCRFLKLVSNARRVSGIGLLAALLFYSGEQAAFALPFFPKKKPPAAESIPPSAQVSPDMLNPHEAPSPSNPSSSIPSVPAEAAKAIEPLEVLIQKGIFPADAATRTQPLNRAELADILVKALGHNTQLVSEFPVYRDVPKDHWAYVSIEVAREKKLIQRLYGKGFYYPERYVTYADVYSAIARAITGPLPTPEVTEHLLQDFTDKESLPKYLAPWVAQMAQVQFFKHTGQEKPQLRPTQLVYAADLAPFITYLMHLIEGRSTIVAEGEQYVPVLPAGLRLSLTPATAILEPQLTVGATVTFTLVTPVHPLPKGSRIRGLVEEAILPSHTYHLQISEAQTPDGTTYQTSAPLTLTFSTKEKLGFFVPGEQFETITQIPPHVPPPEAMPVLPPTPPSGSSENKAVPSFAPHSTK
jgi:hypothetical protein